MYIFLNKCLFGSHNLYRAPVDTSQWLLEPPCLYQAWFDLTWLDSVCNIHLMPVWATNNQIVQTLHCWISSGRIWMTDECPPSGPNKSKPSNASKAAWKHKQMFSNWKQLMCKLCKKCGVINTHAYFMYRLYGHIPCNTSTYPVDCIERKIFHSCLKCYMYIYMSKQT